MKQNQHQPLLPNQIYHLFSRAIGNEKLFNTKENYYFFLQKLKQYTNPVCKVYTYSLLPNHFHLLVKIEEENNIIKHFETVKKKRFDIQLHSLPDFVMERFSNFLNSYTKAFNKVNNRKGALFLDYLKRSLSNSDADFAAFIFYLHKNAVHHGITKSIGEWAFDSYNSILSNKKTSLLKAEVLQFFGSEEAFIKFHQQPVYLKTNFIDI